MTKAEYEDRIAKCEERLAKLDKKIEKHEKKKSVESFVKEMVQWYTADKNVINAAKTLDDLAQAMFESGKEYRKKTDGVDYSDESYLAKCKAKAERDYEEHVLDQEREIENAKSDIESVKETISKYSNAIALIDGKSSRPVIKIFKDFFENWKQEILEWVEPQLDYYYKVNTDLVNMWNNRRSLIGPGKDFPTEDDWKDECKKLESLEKSLLTGWVAIAKDKGFRHDKTDFIKYLDKYMEDRYFELVDKVTKFTGEITDCASLYIGRDGSLNGKIFGDKGGAKIETIIAGGYNQDYIVNVRHGQCRHYRVLVHALND